MNMTVSEDSAVCLEGGWGGRVCVCMCTFCVCVCVCVCVCLSVTALAATVSATNDTHGFLRLYLILNVWNFEKHFRSRVMA